MTNYLRLIFVWGILISAAFGAKGQTNVAQLEQHILNLQATVQTRRSLASELRPNQAPAPARILSRGEVDRKSKITTP